MASFTSGRLGSWGRTPGFMLLQNEMALLSLASNQATIVNLLRKCGFPDEKWFELGLALELSEEDLNDIKTKNLPDVNDVNGKLNIDGCLKQCISLWLLVGEVSFKLLLAAVNSINETTVAEDLLKELISIGSASKVRSETMKKTEEVAPFIGIMHYEEKDLGHWLVKYTVSKDLDLLKQFLDNNPKAQYDSAIDSFKFVQPDGILQLCVQDTPSLESGWTVQPHQIPMQIHQKNIVDDPSYSTCSMSVYAKPGIATAPLHYPIRLTGIDPEITVYINLSPPLSSINSTSSGSGINSETMKKIDEADVSKWLQEGTVNLTVKRVQMLGPPGSGKTCSQRLLLNEDPPEEPVTNSTPIACRAVKATRISAHDDRMERVDAKALLSRLAGDLKAPKKKETQTEDCDTKSKEKSSETIPTSPETKATESPHTTESADATESPKTTESAGDPDANKILQDIVKAIPTAKANLNCNWVYIIDSGGQTAFQELLPLFTRASSFNIITIDLSKDLDEKLDLQYRIDGTPFPCDPTFSYTNMEFIKDVLSSGVILQPYHSPQSKEDTKALQYPEYFVLGTHKDKAEPTQIERYNKELLPLKSGSKEKGYRLIPAQFNSNQIIYPVDTMLKSGPDRQAEAKNFCETIYDNISGDTFQMPVRWFAFELTLLEKAEGHSCLKLDDVLLAGESLEMDEDDTKKALKYLHNVTIILYYHQVLPDIVFIDPHPILNILSRLLALTYKIERKFLRHFTKKTPSESELVSLSKEGIFTESLLDKLNDDQGFPKSDFIKLLLHLHIIVEKENGYFIPSALPHFGSAGSIPESDVVNPLLIVWCNPVNKEILPVPRGIFPLTVVKLMITVNKLQFSFPPTTTDAETNNAAMNQESPKYFRYRNAMSFCIDDVNNDIQVGTIHFIKKHRHIEIHFTGHKDDALKYCPEIREAVTEAINNSSVAINLKLSHKLAFACCSTIDRTEKCYCIVTNEAKEIVQCTLCPKRAIISGQEKYWTWFHVTHQASNEVMTNPCALNITLRDVRSSLKESKFFESKWLDLGDQLGLLPDTLNAIEANHSADVGRCLRETLVKWLAGADDALPSWGSLVKALEAIEENNVAEHIRCKWIKRKHT